MRLYNTKKGPYNFDEKLRPLFEAMQKGQKIKSVTCYAGEINKDNRDLDVTIKNFEVRFYFVAMQSNFDGSKKFDLVVLEPGFEGEDNQFYMNWVIDFEL